MGHWDSAGIPDDFDGLVRMFPLPNLVLFPHVIQALHIFEPRYCDMLTESLESDHLITMALLIPGWENHYQGKPKLASVVCIGRIISHSPTDDGRHNILLAGLQRARIVEELDVTSSFRQARVELMPDVMPEDFKESIDEHRRELLNVFRSVIPRDSANSKTITDLLTQQLPLGILTDIISYAANLPIPIKQLLLGEPNVKTRYLTLMEHMVPIMCGGQDTLGDDPTQSSPSKNELEFPPPFSDN
ncbi:MAG: LON peptidase substrate-binding domain-containing protein [Pirellula staleyi]